MRARLPRSVCGAAALGADFLEIADPPDGKHLIGAVEVVHQRKQWSGKRERCSLQTEMPPLDSGHEIGVGLGAGKGRRGEIPNVGPGDVVDSPPNVAVGEVDEGIPAKQEIDPRKDMRTEVNHLELVAFVAELTPVRFNHRWHKIAANVVLDIQVQLRHPIPVTAWNVEQRPYAQFAQRLGEDPAQLCCGRQARAIP